MALVSELERHFGIFVADSSFFVIESIDDIVRHATVRSAEALPRGGDERQSGEQLRGSDQRLGHAANVVVPEFSNMNWETDDDRD